MKLKVARLVSSKVLPGHNCLGHRFVDDDVIGPVIGSDVFDFDGRPFPHPFLARSAGTERQSGRQVRLGRLLSGRWLAFDAHQIAEDESGNVGRFPKGRVEQMGQSGRRE